MCDLFIILCISTRGHDNPLSWCGEIVSILCYSQPEGIVIIRRVSLGFNAPWPKPTWKLEIDKILFRWVFGRKLPNHEPITSMKWDKTLDETRTKFPLFRVDIWTRRKNPELVTGTKDRRKVVCGSDCIEFDYDRYNPAHFHSTELWSSPPWVCEKMCVRTRVLIGPKSASWTMNTGLKWLNNKPGACLDSHGAYWDISRGQGELILPLCPTECHEYRWQSKCQILAGKT